MLEEVKALEKNFKIDLINLKALLICHFYQIKMTKRGKTFNILQTKSMSS